MFFEIYGAILTFPFFQKNYVKECFSMKILKNRKFSKFREENLALPLPINIPVIAYQTSTQRGFQAQVTNNRIPQSCFVFCLQVRSNPAQ